MPVRLSLTGQAEGTYFLVLTVQNPAVSNYFINSYGLLGLVEDGAGF